MISSLGTKLDGVVKHLPKQWVNQLLSFYFYFFSLKHQFYCIEISSTKKGEKSFQEVHNPLYIVQ